MAAPLHKKMRNVLRSHRYNDPSIPLDDDVLETLKLWKWGADEPPQFYDDSITEGGGEVGVMSDAGEEWLLQNKHLADQFISESSGKTSGVSVKPGDRYSRLFDDDLKRNVCYPLWPRGVEGMVPPLLWIWSYLYRDTMLWAWRIFWFLLVSHAVEVVLVLLWLQPVGFTYTAKLAWALYSFVCGWPITGRAKILAGIVLSKEEKREAARMKKALAKKNAELKGKKD